jgi:hypothetical protein
VTALPGAEWHQQVTLHLSLYEHVPAVIKAAIKREHDMLADHLEIGPLPQALLNYVRAEYLDRRYQGYEPAVWYDLVNALPGER